MRSIHIILDTHSDHEINDLLSTHIDWIRENFTMLLMESVPSNLTGHDALTYYFQIICSYKIDCQKQTDFLSPDEITFLSADYTADMSPDEFINKRAELISRFVPHMEPYGLFPCLLNTYKRYQLYSRCLSLGINLAGLEAHDYKIASMSMGSRDVSMIKSTFFHATAATGGILMIVGASHGINLISNLCRFGQHSCHFIRLVTHEKYNDDSSFEKWYQEDGSRLHLGYGNSIMHQDVSMTSSYESQRLLLNALINTYSGCALPGDKEYNLSSGGVVAKP